MNEVNALLGKGSEFEGKLTFEGTVRIDGRFTGDIHSEDTLIIGESALVRAEIRVDTVIVYGEVIGNVTATSCVELHAPARLKGNIITPNLQADKGVVFDGNVKMWDQSADVADALPEAPPQRGEAADVRGGGEGAVKGLSVLSRDELF
jgi:cytoskeletal protein CcmA (bactofilin family)